MSLLKYKIKGKLGLALSSGAAHGLAHIGVLKVIEENHIDIKYVSGASVGALIGALWCAGYTADQIYDIAKNIKWKNIVRLTLPTKGLFSNRGLEKLIKEKIPHNRIERLNKNFGCVATNLKNESADYFTEGTLADKIAASCAIPVIFKPIEINNNYYIDGGFIETVPSPMCRAMGADSVIGVKLNEYFKFTGNPDNMPKIILHTIKIMSQKNMCKKYVDEGDVLITPKIKKIDYDGLNRIDQLVDKGRKAAEKMLNNINGKYFLKKSR